METPVRRKNIPPQRRQQIFEAAAELFSHSGYHGVTVDAIARRAGISKGNLYWYFNSKREIF
ncbi:MAG: TetR/AcrR family transcriptional regulator, partial [Dehalococcoidia bacterium]|nr:TetR/AcrR family transcriptional regulator [Dehalococcoidia bacterium]